MTEAQLLNLIQKHPLFKSPFSSEDKALAMLMLMDERMKRMEVMLAELTRTKTPT